MPADKCMWKYPSGVPNGVKTRSKANNEPTTGMKKLSSISLPNTSFIDWSWKKKIFCTIKFI